MSDIVVRAIVLGHEDMATLAVPVPGPLLVGPAQREGKVRAPSGQDLVEGPFQEPPAIEPVVVVDESGESVLASQRRLGFTNLRHSQVVVPEFAGNVGLVVTGIERTGLCYI